MNKKLLILVLLLLAVLVSACGNGEPEETAATEPSVTETTAPTEPPKVDIGGTELAPDTAALDLSTMTYDLDTLIAAAENLTQVTEINLGVTDLNYEQYTALCAAYPNAAVSYSVSLFGQELTTDTEYLDLSDMTVEQTEELVSVLPLLPNVNEINFVNEEGVCVYGVETIEKLDSVRELVPEAYLHVSFTLFGQTVTSEDERIEYYLVQIGNDGVETVRAVLPYLRSCTYLLMDGCDVDNEVMAQLREDFPETKVVWRVWVITPDYTSAKLMRWGSFLTDTHRVRTTLVDNETAKVLKYCVETKYVDFGHNFELSDFSFLGYMPDLEVAIIAITDCDDISFLTNCPNLEYLEVYGTKVTDLSPLASCTNLRHLNISRMEVDDITCLYGLELERFRAVDTKIPKSQIDEYAKLHPDCEMLMKGWAPHENGWRYDSAGNMVPRYKLLREQMEYAIDKEYGIP